MHAKRITAVLLAETIEAARDFWVGRLGFTATMEVPGAAGLVFAAVVKDGAEIMYQTYASVEQSGQPAMAAAARRGPTYLYVEVDDLNAVLAATHDLPRVMAEHTTFYGMREFAVQDPAGHFITFAQPAKQE